VRLIKARRGDAPPPDAVADFARLYYDSERRTWKNTRWLGVGVQKTPLDLWIYQEVITDIRPALIVETGTAAGGSALYMATVSDALGTGEIISVDIAKGTRPTHPRITYLHGSSISRDVCSAVAERARTASPVIVILDSDHSRDHVLAELDCYAELVTPGSYLIVEDTNINGHPVLPKFGPGPKEAVSEFLGSRTDFEIDRECEKFFLTFNPGGYLRRVG
jgi:cephalosporin hydroxylase